MSFNLESFKLFARIDSDSSEDRSIIDLAESAIDCIGSMLGATRIEPGKAQGKVLITRAPGNAAQVVLPETQAFYYDPLDVVLQSTGGTLEAGDQSKEFSVTARATGIAPNFIPKNATMTSMPAIAGVAISLVSISGGSARYRLPDIKRIRHGVNLLCLHYYESRAVLKPENQKAVMAMLRSLLVADSDLSKFAGGVKDAT